MYLIRVEMDLDEYGGSHYGHFLFKDKVAAEEFVLSRQKYNPRLAYSMFKKILS